MCFERTQSRALFSAGTYQNRNCESIIYMMPRLWTQVLKAFLKTQMTPTASINPPQTLPKVPLPPLPVSLFPLQSCFSSHSHVVLLGTVSLMLVTLQCLPYSWYILSLPFFLFSLFIFWNLKWLKGKSKGFFKVSADTSVCTLSVRDVGCAQYEDTGPNPVSSCLSFLHYLLYWCSLFGLYIWVEVICT